jgi:hypothetical protein
MKLYNDVLDALNIVNNLNKDSLSRILKHEDLKKVKKLLDEQLPEYLPTLNDDENEET